MTNCFELHEKKITRRSVLSGALTVGSGVVLSAAVASVTSGSAMAAAKAGTGRNLHPSLASMPSGIADGETGSTGTRFSKEFLSNRVFQDLPLNFDPPNPARVDHNLQGTGALVQPNGDVLFRIYAPKAKDVTLQFSLVRDGQLVLTQQNEGLFQGLLPYEDNHTGPMSVDVYVDGMLFIYPMIPICWSLSSPRNIIEIPDTTMEFMHIKNVPHGAMGREIYWAEPLKTWERCTVYSPAGYMKSTKEYPVLYLQHGGGENEVAWEYFGRVAYIMDNLIAEGKAEPFIVVMNNDMLRYSDTPAGIIDLAFERMLIESCIPYIEKNYRVKTGKWNRAIAGLSMGCMMSCDIAFRHPEVFGNMGALNASMIHDAESFHTNYVRPYPEVMKDAEAFAKNYRVYFRSTMSAEDHFPYFLADDEICAKAGIDKLPNYHRILYPERTTKWNGWRMGLRDYAQLLFR